MSESNKILTPEYLDWHAKLTGLPSILTDKIHSKLYKRYKKQTGNEPWQLSEAVIDMSAEPVPCPERLRLELPQASDFKPITFEVRPDPESIIQSSDPILFLKSHPDSILNLSSQSGWQSGFQFSKFFNGFILNLGSIRIDP